MNIKSNSIYSMDKELSECPENVSTSDVGSCINMCSFKVLFHLFSLTPFAYWSVIKAQEKIWASVISVSPHPHSAIGDLDHCQREIRIRLTVSWLVLNQEKTQMMPVFYLRKKSAYRVQMISFLFMQHVFLQFAIHVTNIGCYTKCPSSWFQESN